MRFSKKQLITGLIVMASITAFILFFLNIEADKPLMSNTKFKEMTVERGTFEIMVTANGIVKPIDRVEIKSKASGEIVDLPVERGDFIRKGDLIARLDQKDERADVAQAQADLDIAKAELTQAHRTYDRRDRLFQNKLISEEERDQIELSLAVANGKVIQSTTSLERAQERLSEAVVRSPIDGVILQKYVEEGQIIASGVSNVSGGTPIVDVADMSSVYIEAGIDEIDIGKVQVGQTAEVVAEAYPQLKINGKIVRIAPEAKIEQNVTLFDVIIEVENTDGKLKSGMNTSIEITIAREENVLLAPAMALQTSGRGETMARPQGAFNNSRGRRSQGTQNGDRPRRGRGGANVRMVLLKQGDEFVPTRVKIGLSNFKHAIILDGVEEGSILGVPMTSRLKAENDRLENRIRSSRSFGTSNRSSSSQQRRPN